jgi:hypothetical protein
MSFVGGPYFAALRERILKSASVLRLDLIDKRSDVFLDVLYDLCVVVLRKSGGPGRPSTPKSSLLRIGEPDLDLGLIDLPAQPDKRVWVLPDVKDNNTLFPPGFETLAGYGYLTMRLASDVQERHIDPSGAGGSDSRLNVIATLHLRPRRERFKTRMFVERVGHCAPGEIAFNIRSE